MAKIDKAIMMTDGLVNSSPIDDIIIQDERRGYVQYQLIGMGKLNYSI